MDNNAQSGIAFLKGHGTENDFVLLLDTEAQLDLTEERIQRIADRRAGVGGDGVIRIVTGQALIDAGVLAELPGDARANEWFMDYRNADGSIAEMCGNGVRVFAHACVAQGLVDVEDGGRFGVGTRGGRKEVTIHHADARTATVSVDMGEPDVQGVSTAEVNGDALKVAGLAVSMGNPHVAAVIPGLTVEQLAALPIDQPVTWDESFFPDGVNLEVLTPLVDGEVHMRVHERGVGETRSCGTGTVAATVAALADAGEAFGTVRVNVPGGQVEVTVTEGSSVLKGPSEIVAEGTLYL